MVKGVNYSVNLTDGTNFTGKFVEKESDGMWLFVTKYSNYVINSGGSSYVQVPAYFFVNPAQVTVLKEIYTEEECKEYWVISDNTYDFEKKPTKVLLTDWQRENITDDITLFFSEEECKKACEKNHS